MKIKNLGSLKWKENSGLWCFWSCFIFSSFVINYLYTIQFVWWCTTGLLHKIYTNSHVFQQSHLFHNNSRIKVPFNSLFFTADACLKTLNHFLKYSFNCLKIDRQLSKQNPGWKKKSTLFTARYLWCLEYQFKRNENENKI